MGVTIGYDNLLATATLTSSSEAAGYAAANAADFNTYDSWKPTVVPAWVMIDAGVGQTFAVDYFAVMHQLSTDGGAIEFQGSTDDIVWDTIVSTITPTDDNPIFRQFATETYRYFRVYLTGTVSALPLINVGVRLDIPVGLRVGQSLLNWSREVEMTSSIGDSGQLIGASKRADGAKGNILLTFLTPTWIRSNWDSFADHASIGRPWFFQHNNTDFEDETAILWIDKNFPTPRYSHANFISVDLKVSGIVR